MHVFNNGNKFFNHQSLLLPLLLVTIFASIFGYWFATQQLLAVAKDAVASYPSQYFLLTITRCVLTMISFFCCSCLYLRMLSANKLSFIAIAVTFFPLTLVFAHVSLFNIMLTLFFLQFIFLVSVIRMTDYQRLWQKLGIDLLALLTLFSLHFFITTQFSPLHWKMAMFTSDGFVSEEIPVVATLFKSFALAKQFSFSSFDHTQWAGILNPPITLASPLLQLITLIFDLPSMSAPIYHSILAAINFILFVGGSFGFYLFLKYSIRINPLFALLGGCLFFFSNAPFILTMISSDGGVFLSSYAVFPFALLLISLAFQKNSLIFASSAGLALNTQFFLYSPHPEGTIYSYLFFGVYAIGLMLFTKSINFRRKFALVNTAVFSTLLLASYVLLPILYDEIRGYMHTFAHSGDVNAIDLNIFSPYTELLKIFLPITLLFIYLEKRINPAILSMVFYTLTLFLILYFTSKTANVQFLLNVLHIGLHFWLPWRIGMFFCIGTFTMMMVFLDTILRHLLLSTSKRFSHLSKQVSI